MNLNGLNLAECLPIVATIDPLNRAAKATGDVIDMSELEAVLMIVSLGDMAAQTIDGGFESSAASNMGTPATPKAFTQVAAHAADNDNDQLVMFLRGDELADGHRYVRPYFTPGGDTVGSVSVVVLGVPKYQPGDAQVPDLASVVQIVK